MTAGGLCALSHSVDFVVYGLYQTAKTVLAKHPLYT